LSKEDIMLWMITDFSKSKNFNEAKESIAIALNSGAGMVSLRNNGTYDRSQIRQLAASLISEFPQKKIYLHNPEEEFLEDFDNYHFSQRFFNEAVALKKINKNKVIAVSLHSEEMIEKAFLKGLDYAFYSPVYPPISKPDDKRETVEPIYMKNLYLLGGINRMRGRSLIENGFTNLAGISLFYGDTAVYDISELSELIMEKVNG
jgi:thiamine monophosphate synthase